MLGAAKNYRQDACVVAVEGFQPGQEGVEVNIVACLCWLLL